LAVPARQRAHAAGQAWAQGGAPPRLTCSAAPRAQLKLLACHISGGEQSGTVYANGLPIVEAEFKNQLAVVWQSDVLLSTATVRPTAARGAASSAGWAQAQAAEGALAWPCKERGCGCRAALELTCVQRGPGSASLCS